MPLRSPTSNPVASSSGYRSSMLAATSEPIVDPAFSDGAFFANKLVSLALDWTALPILLALVAFSCLGMLMTMWRFE